MTKTIRQAVSIAPGHNKPNLSRGQKAFNTLIRQIEKRRERLRAWEAVRPTFQKRYVDELLPLVRESTDLQGKMVHRLDSAWEQKGLTKTERRTISQLITGLAGDLIDESEDAQLKVIFNKHSRSDYDSEAAAEREDMKTALEAMLGIELGDDFDMNSPDEVLQRVHASMEEQQAQQAADSHAREERRSKRKKSAKQLAAQAQKDAEQAEVSKSIREVFRKLASALHPDREADPMERERKTALMQRANQAYARNDLLTLLELQLEMEHIDQGTINDISEGRLKHYNKVLKEQLAELDEEILHIEFGFKESYGIAPFIDVSPGTVLRNLTNDIAAVRQGIRELETDLLVFQDVKQIKSWLKQLKRRQASVRFDEMSF
ncbi:J domain-containing protein [Paraburkholderia phenoliruptrix]|uniref:J domain-containing protein n=1 Tax=Paraburkholderia phenoliruptrix TaxID=252970 RepID=UPI002869E4D0|nr:molecular chaperone DnaJ [Paraburkholderia phenoliruptrix]WMY10950.1 molecular chaperone DnaJ [Paraburkholderia phenoliruptrix]